MISVTPGTANTDVMANVKTLRILPSGHGIELYFFMAAKL
jgi:hypothetical protein